MLINREVLITSLMEYKNDFLKFIDYINASGNGLEFPEIAYIHFYNNKIAPQKDKTIKHKLSLQTLEDSGIFTYRDVQAGTLVLSKVVYDLLVFLDVSRNKQLTLAHFESLRKQMVEVVGNLQATEIGSDDHQDYLQLFYEQLSSVLTTIKENILVLNQEVDNISERYQLLGQGDRAANINELYELTQKLAVRHVQPCLEFINPDLRIVNSMNFIEALDSLEAFYRDAGDITRSISISYKKTAISAHYKDIAVLSDRLRSYLYNLSEERHYFMAIEYRFSQLEEMLTDFRHGKLINTTMKPDWEHLKHMTCFDGLADHKKAYTVLFDRSPTASISHFKNYYEDVNNRPIKRKTSLKPVTQPPTNKEMERKNVIMYIMANLDVPSSIEDVYFFIQESLLLHLPDYSLIDTVYGSEFFLPLLSRKALRQTAVRRLLEDDNNYFEYITLTYDQELAIWLQ